jgi:hypothetical protein
MSTARGGQIWPAAVVERRGGCTGWSAAEGMGSVEARRPRMLPSPSKSGGGGGLICGCVWRRLGGVWEVVLGGAVRGAWEA